MHTDSPRAARNQRRSLLLLHIGVPAHGCALRILCEECSIAASTSSSQLVLYLPKSLKRHRHNATSYCDYLENQHL